MPDVQDNISEGKNQETAPHKSLESETKEHELENDEEFENLTKSINATEKINLFEG